jgi:glycosyltransferase involved in cell wall biosynthesis
LGKKFGTMFRAWVKTIAVRRVRRFWVETSTAKAGLARRLGISPERIDVVPNAVNRLFVPLPGPPPPGRIRILHLSAYYPHKNHAFLLPVAKALRRLHPDFDFEFVVTLPQDGQPWKELSASFDQAGLAERIRTLGYLEVKNCPAAYRDCHVVFHPSLLEIFSATYLEAFAARRPVVASDLDFAHEVCGDAASYFDPLTPEGAAAALFRAASDQDLRDDLINKGLMRHAVFPKANDKNQHLLSLIEEGLPYEAP